MVVIWALEFGVVRRLGDRKTRPYGLESMICLRLETGIWDSSCGIAMLGWPENRVDPILVLTIPSIVAYSYKTRNG